MRTPFARPSRSQAGFKIAELMVAVGIFVVGGGVAYPLLVGDVALYARNFSLNKSNNSLRLSLQRLKQDIDMAIEPPRLVNYRVSGTTGVLKPTTDATVSAQGILLWVSLGPSYDMQASGSGNTTVPVTSTITLNRRVNTSPSASDPFPNSPMPQIGDRLVIMSPLPYNAGMPENVAMDGVSIQKPGRRITQVNGQTSGRVTDTNAASLTVRLDLGNTALPSKITGPQSVYVAREVAYVVYTLNDAGGNPVERQLIRYGSTADMTNGDVLIRDVDPSPLELDTKTSAVIQPFNYYGGRGTQSPLSIHLPVRAIDYANVITTKQATTSSEFNVYLHSSPQMDTKVSIR